MARQRIDDMTEPEVLGHTDAVLVEAGMGRREDLWNVAARMFNPFGFSLYKIAFNSDNHDLYTEI